MRRFTPFLLPLCWAIASCQPTPATLCPPAAGQSPVATALVDGIARAPISLLSTGTSEPLSREAPVAAGEVSLGDGGGRPLPGPHVDTSTDGRFALTRAPSGHTVQVLVRKTGADGKPMTLRSLVEPGGAGAHVEVGIASTMLTLWLTRGLKGGLGPLNQAAFDRAIAIIYTHLAGETAIDLRDTAGILVKVETWLAGDATLTALADTVREGLMQNGESYEALVAEFERLNGQSAADALKPAHPTDSPAPAAATSAPTLAPEAGVTALPEVFASPGSVRTLGTPANAFGALGGLDVFRTSTGGGLLVCDGTNHLILSVGSDDQPHALSTQTVGAPADVAAERSGTVYVADRTGQVIYRISKEGKASIFAGTGAAGHSDGSLLEASFDGPVGLVIDGSDHMMVAEATGRVIRMIQLPSGPVTTLAGRYGQSGYANGSGAQALFAEPRGLAVDREGVVYIADAGNHAIRKLTRDGLVTTLSGTLTEEPGAYVEGSATVARFNHPSGLAYDDTHQRLVVADTTNHRIRGVALPSGYTTLVAGSGERGLVDGVGAGAGFAAPIDVTVGTAGEVYVSDTGNTRLRRID